MLADQDVSLGAPATRVQSHGSNLSGSHGEGALRVIVAVAVRIGVQGVDCDVAADWLVRVRGVGIVVPVVQIVVGVARAVVDGRVRDDGRVRGDVVGQAVVIGVEPGLVVELELVVASG